MVELSVCLHCVVGVTRVLEPFYSRDVTKESRRSERPIRMSGGCQGVSKRNCPNFLRPKINLFWREKVKVHAFCSFLCFDFDLSVELVCYIPAFSLPLINKQK